MNDAENQLRNCLPDLLAQPEETRWLEFKVDKLDSARVGEYISALANGACLDKQSEGWLLLGVENETHAVVGTHKRLRKMRLGNEDLEFHLRRKLDPCPAFEFCHIEWEGQVVEAVRVAPVLGQPVRYGSEAFIRINSQTTTLRKYPDLARAIYNSQQDWFECICEGATVEDLDEEALRVARRVFLRRHQEIADDIEQWDDTVFLNRVKLMRKEKVTRAAILLLGKGTSSHLLTPVVAEMTWKLDSAGERAYEHFGLPFMLSTTRILQKIRNYAQKIFPNNSLIPSETMKYDTEMVLEAMHNCIAHQDYTRASRIIVTEHEDRLVFRNVGSFYSGKPQDYPLGNHTPERYRNKFLAEAMTRLGMVDTMGYGIHKMYVRQRERCFPMPDFNLEPDAVELTIYGKTISEDYGKILLERTDVTLEEAIALDYVQKKQSLPDDSVAALRQRHLIEGRKPHYFIAKDIAVVTGKKVEYLEHKGINRKLLKEHIVNAIREVKSMNRAEISQLIERHLATHLTDKQKYDLTSRLIWELSTKENRIQNIGTARRGAVWSLVKT